MRLRTAAAAVAATALTSAAFATPALSAGKTATTLTIQTEQDGFSGFVKSKRSACHSGRVVTLFRKVAGPDKRAGSDTAQPNQDGSQWKISVSRDGSYYAVVKATSKCAGRTSATKRIALDDSEGASAAADEPALTTLRIARGRERGFVSGRVHSTDPACVDGRKVILYRAILNDARDIIREDRIGYFIAASLRPESSFVSKPSLFKVARNGYVVMRAPATDRCAAAKSRYVYINRPEPATGSAATAAQAGPKAGAKLVFRQGTGANRGGVVGTLSSSNPDCVQGRKVLFFRQYLSASGEVLREERIGYSIAELADYEDAHKSKAIKFKLVRSGRVFAKVLATDDCVERRGNVVRFTRL